MTPGNWVAPAGAAPGFLPNGFGVVVTGAAMVFFSYIGFDAVSTHAEETRNPGRNLPIGILGSLAICTALYVGVAVVLVGMIPWPNMPAQAPVVNAFVQQGGWVARAAGVVIGIGAIALLALMGTRQPHPAARYDAATRSFTLPGSWLPLALILGIFSVKYVVGVELVMQPALAHDGLYTLVAGGLYGLFSGAFAGRALRTFRLAFAGMPGSYAAHA